MFKKLMDLIQKNSDKLADSLLQEIRVRQDCRRIAEGTDDAEAALNFLKVRNIFEELWRWLIESSRKGTLTAYYSSLVDRRYLQRFSLKDIVMVVLILQKEILSIVIDEIEADSGFSSDQTVEVLYRVNLFFDLIIHSVISGHRGLPGRQRKDAGGEAPFLSTIFLG